MLEERVKFVNAAIEGAWPFADLCRSHGISRKTGYKFLERYERYGLEGLVDRSRARFEQADRTPDHIVDRIVEERRAHPYWGPRKILRYLQRTNPSILDWPAISTAGEILKRHGLVQDRKTKRRTPSGIPRDPARADRPNLVWCADFKGHFRTGDGSRCDPLTVSDDFSRFVLGCRCVAGLGFEHVKPAFIRIFEQYGLPQVIRTDNGAPFASTGIGGLSPLSVWWIKLGITPQRIDPGQPQQQGAHERMHRTLKNETVVPPKADLRSQQKAFDKFRKEYNNDRPHEALGDRTPAEFYSPSPKPFPAHEPEAAYPSHYEVRRVERKGSLKFANKDIFLGSALATELVGFESASDHHWRIYFRHIPVAIFDTESKKILRFALFTGE